MKEKMRRKTSPKRSTSPKRRARPRWRRHVFFPLYHDFHKVYWDASARFVGGDPMEAYQAEAIGRHPWTDARGGWSRLRLRPLGPLPTFTPRCVKDNFFIDATVVDFFKYMTQPDAATVENNRYQLELDIHRATDWCSDLDALRRMLYAVFVDNEYLQSPRVPRYGQGMERVVYDWSATPLDGLRTLFLALEFVHPTDDSYVNYVGRITMHEPTATASKDAVLPVFDAMHEAMRTCNEVTQVLSLAQQLEAFSVQAHPTYAKVRDALARYVGGIDHVIGVAKEPDLLALFRGRRNSE